MARMPHIILCILAAGCSLLVQARGLSDESPGAAPAVLAEYERKAAACEATAEAHYALAEWCRRQRLLEQRRDQLERAIAIDPDHEPSRQALGYERLGDEWLPEEEAKSRAGLVRYDGRWRTEQAVKLLEEKKQRDRSEKSWLRELARARKILNTNFDLGRQKILEINDPLAVPALAERMRSESYPEVRRIQATTLARIGTPDAVQELVRCSLHDPVEDVRLHCLDEIRIAGLSEKAAGYYLPELRSADNVMINRAAAALGELKSPSAVGALINAVVTRHSFTVAQAPSGQTNVSFGTGPGGSGGGFSTGSKPPQKITRNLNNQSVVDALEAITGQNFGFDEAAWRAWYASTKPQVADIDIRRD